ncbi:hypothetical protein AAY473_014094 [Plecturocebus cupreus]
MITAHCSLCSWAQAILLSQPPKQLRLQARTIKPNKASLCHPGWSQTHGLKRFSCHPPLTSYLPKGWDYRFDINENKCMKRNLFYKMYSPVSIVAIVTSIKSGEKTSEVLTGLQINILEEALLQGFLSLYLFLYSWSSQQDKVASGQGQSGSLPSLKLLPEAFSIGMSGDWIHGNQKSVRTSLEVPSSSHCSALGAARTSYKCLESYKTQGAT